MRNELIIGGLKADTIEGLEVNITKEVYSIVDPSKRKSDFTKTVQIPGSKANDYIFASLFDVNFSIRSATQLSPDFNPSKKASCTYSQDSFIQIKGYCQLTEIKVLENNKVLYEVVIYGKVANLFADIADLMLTDLTTLGTATWDDASIIDSWTDTFDAVVKPVYPCLNRGKAIFNRPIGTPIAEWSYDYNAFKPWMYVKHIVTAIITEAGYSLEESAFFETEQFRRLIIECDVKKFQQDQAAIAQTEVRAARATSNQTIVPVSNANVGDMSLVWATQLIYNSESSDPDAQFDTATGTLTIGADSEGYASIVTSFNANITFGANLSGVNVNFVMIRKRSGVYTPIKFFSHFLGSVISGNVNSVSVINFQLDSAPFETGDEIRVCLLGATSTTGTQNNNISNFTLLTTTNNFGFFIDGQIGYGQTFDIASILPTMRQTDFLMGIFKLYNLYIDSLPNEGLVIEPRDDYFTSDIINWTEKLDTSRDFTISPQGLLENKEILFTYSNNDDDLSRYYKQSVGYEYGYKRLIFDNEFVKDKRELKLPFALCPLRTDTDFGNVNMVTMFDGAGAEKSNHPIIAYFGNMKSGSMVYWEQTGPTRTTYSTYPYAGPIDDVVSPNYSLEFSQPELFYHTSPGTGGVSVTDNNTYAQFHEPQWQETGHRDSKLVSAYFKLSADDIEGLSFRPSYYIREAYYRLLEVQDHNPDGRSTTLCKFLKLNTFTPETPAVTTVSGGGGQGGNTQGDLFRHVGQGNQKAWGNTLGKNTSGVSVLGTGNIIGDGSTSIIIQGDDNTILPGVSNVTLINTSGLTISESDVTYIGGKKVSVGSPSNGQVWTYNSSTGAIGFQTPATPTKRIGTTVSSAAPTADADLHDQYNITALATNATFGAPIGTPHDGQEITYRVKDDGTPRTLAYNAIFRNLGVTPPAVTVASKTTYIATKYNAADTKWDILAHGTEE